MLHSAILQGPYLQGQLHQRKPGDASSSSHYTEPTVYQTSQEQLADSLSWQVEHNSVSKSDSYIKLSNANGLIAVMISNQLIFKK